MAMAITVMATMEMTIIKTMETVVPAWEMRLAEVRTIVVNDVAYILMGNLQMKTQS